LAERLARETGWAVLTFNFRGTAASEGDFSLDGWLSDLKHAVDVMSERADVGGVWLTGSSTGGSLSILLAADDERVRGVATLAAPASFSEWAMHPDRLLADSRALGLIRHAAFPPDPAAWGRQFAELSPLEAATRITPRPLLLIHGENDEVVPVADARALFEAAYGNADLRTVAGAGHRLRHDPRAIATLIGWMTRQSP
jgi:putative redox protein